ncbi:hypothetical protein NLU13_5203 [Sarocladium strictum]|uniref:MARVEL domain-containing protein n=1 Tax=Sarocladium strictum TaxID=5046 RepID=A0AA39GGG0_SARSR|nr:hypothetical protein NLU13_5203 [Sarocladium strictum]
MVQSAPIASTVTMSNTGTAHKVVSVLLRLTELACGAIVLGLLGNFVHQIKKVDEASTDGRIIYSMVVAGIAIVYSILVCVPVKKLFLGFPVDFLLFIMWLVAYCLLQNRTAGSTCSSEWYYDYWGYYWGSYWEDGPVGRVTVNGAGCAQWRTVLAFSFIGWFLHLISGILGVYVFLTYIRADKAEGNAKRHHEKLHKRHRSDDTGYSQQGINGQNPAEMTPPVMPATVPATATAV